MSNVTRLQSPAETVLLQAGNATATTKIGLLIPVEETSLKKTSLAPLLKTNRHFLFNTSQLYYQEAAQMNGEGLRISNTGLCRR